MKFNNKQKKIMRGGALILFSIALALILKLLFNVNTVEKGEYDGQWYIGYKYYEGNTTDKLVYVYTRKIHLFSDNTFYIEQEKSYKASDEIINGNYKIEDDVIVLKYTLNGESKEEKYYLSDNKICLDRSCSKYYTKDKIEQYIEQFNTKVEKAEE